MSWCNCRLDHWMHFCSQTKESPSYTFWSVFRFIRRDPICWLSECLSHCPLLQHWRSEYCSAKYFECPLCLVRSGRMSHLRKDICERHGAVLTCCKSAEELIHWNVRGSVIAVKVLVVQVMKVVPAARPLWKVSSFYGSANSVLSMYVKFVSKVHEQLRDSRKSYIASVQRAG